ncbi:TetR family transcriptional regulator [Homoserinimonas aerilata]|uniref:TetR family transcriptional regulator n=1 Tax=Homoserinimonas aerilata TaxID=1162970 RepID=A0A542YI94_9MICO|nr:TetR/AcrR family transcriptional regulator [Homoserinimonas aerilata]TQL47721.1 TetR family transcriptional regulator [Homoserinimonas aerilata]
MTAIPQGEAGTPRSQAKAERRTALLTAAAAQFAERGYSRVSLEELGAAVGVSGPAVYRHFSGKQAVLTELLVGVSASLRAGGQAVVDEHPDAAGTLAALVAFHVDFALGDADVIRVQDRDLDSLAEDARHDVRRLQRSYSELWVDALALTLPEAPRSELRVRVQAVFGLINSTPHSVRAASAPPTRGVLEAMALAALTA